jgi:hypothetical protein
MHRRFYEGNNSHINQSEMSDEHLQFALRQSNQAIRKLVKANGPGGQIAVADKVTLMTCSVLFNSMACLQGHQREGMQHLRSGIRLLNELDSEKCGNIKRHPISVESLRTLFVGLDMQARSIMTSEEARDWDPIRVTREQSDLQDVDTNHASLVAMQVHIQTLINQSLAFLQVTVRQNTNKKEVIYHEYHQLLARFDRSTRLLEKLRAKAASSAIDISQALAFLQLLHTQLEYYLKVQRSGIESEYAFINDALSSPFDLAAHFSKMLDFARQLLAGNASQSPVFTTTMGPLAALWMIVTRAPSSCLALRKHAVQLLLSHPRREGFWDGLIAGQMAQEVLRIEQESTRAELGFAVMAGRELVVPDDLRIVVVELTYDEVEDRKARVAYRTAQDMVSHLPGKVGCLTW